MGVEVLVVIRAATSNDEPAAGATISKRKLPSCQVGNEASSVTAEVKIGVLQRNMVEAGPP